MIALMTEAEVAAFGKGPGMGVLECEAGWLPLTAMQIDARVRGVMVAIDVAQTFVNAGKTVIEATYTFPLPDRLAVNRFRMEVAGRVVEGVIEERGVAREQYDEAIAKGHRAAITEEDRAGVFTLRVGNLLPGETAVVRLSLVGPLAVDDGEVTLQFPLLVAPRYIPGNLLGGEQAGLGTRGDTDLVPDASRISPPVRIPGLPNAVRLSIKVAIEDRVRDLASSLHAITQGSNDARTVELAHAERLDRDFILRWRIDGDELRSTLVCSDDADGKAGTFMLTLVPPSTTTVASKPRDVVFVLDRSGSMEGWKMVAARRACGRMIDSLTSRDRFCAIAFDTELQHIPRAEMVAATDRERFRAVEELAKVESRGGTEMLQPLQAAVALVRDGYTDRERIVVLVTDGQVGNEDHLLHELGDLKNVRVFALGIDDAVNGGFLRRLASAGAGLCELVESEDRLDAVMAKVHRRIGTPIATELALEASGLEVDRTQLTPMTTPGKLPDVYAGAPVTILGRYRGPAPANANLELRGHSFGEPYAQKVTATTGRDLAASWARARIRDLEDRYAAGSKELANEIVRVSKDHGVLSRFTAFLAVDRSEIANHGGRITQVVQPVESQEREERAKMSHGPSGQTAGGSMRARFAPQSNAPAEKPSPAPMPMRMKSVMVGGPPAMPSSPAAAPMAPREALSRNDVEDPTPYFTSLTEIARALAAATSEPARKLVMQRLRQWIEDVRSVGHVRLADAAEALIATNRDPAELASQLLTVATETSPAAAGRAFWK